MLSQLIHCMFSTSEAIFLVEADGYSVGCEDKFPSLELGVGRKPSTSSGSSSLIKEGGVLLDLANSLGLQREQIKGCFAEGEGNCDGLEGLVPDNVMVVGSDESLNDLSFQKLVSFSELLGLLVEGFEKEVESLLRELEVRKGHKVVEKGEDAARVGGSRPLSGLASAKMGVGRALCCGMVGCLFSFLMLFGVPCILRFLFLPVGRVENTELLAAELGCKVRSLPSTYLGLPLGASHKSVKVWDGVEERMRKKLALWKGQFISKEEESLSSGRGALEKRPHLVKWAVVCTHKKMGGLGIRNLSILNRALLCKWSWRFAVERDSYWKLIISTKYGVERGGWSTCGAREGHGVGLWKEISKEGLLLLNNVSFLVGIGKRVSSKDAWVADYWDPMGEEEGGLHFSLDLSTIGRWREVERLLSSIQGKRLDADGEDRMLWKGTKNEIFTVKSLYKSLAHSCAVSFPGNIFWSPHVPSKVSFFAWEASWEKVLTQDQLKRRGWILANRCCLCCIEEETINHILVHCSRRRFCGILCFLFLGLIGCCRFR
ncbi:putative ribonuclease H protein [Vitis vinifera]|uniref:Putative ribonuclease H protein n=1 Tax=Vitis vinifera TaxID=29760 RepID=A0A438JK62_VITVI|nr:putative ribonuclease H protein [Vitis vinifera]